MRITFAQIRGGRGMLGWTQHTLAERAGIAKETVVNLEKGQSAVQADTLAKVREAFEIGGLVFTENGGIEPRDNLLMVLEGETANFKVLDDIYHRLKDTGGEVLIAGLSEVPETDKAHYDYLMHHLKRLQEAGITERILIEAGDTHLVAPPHWYRYLPKDRFSNTPFQIYGDRIAMKEWTPVPRILVIEHPQFANTLRNLFDLVWDQAEPVTTGRL